jgi:molybdopterin-biosynthesis enzyme MoeA-like protein
MHRNPLLTATLAAALLVGHAPAGAQSIDNSVNTFCSAIRRINAQGFSAAPGTAAAQLIVNNTRSQTHADYRMVWQFAQASAIRTCRGIW